LRCTYENSNEHVGACCFRSPVKGARRPAATRVSQCSHASALVPFLQHVRAASAQQPLLVTRTCLPEHVRQARQTVSEHGSSLHQLPIQVDINTGSSPVSASRSDDGSRDRRAQVAQANADRPGHVMGDAPVKHRTDKGGGNKAHQRHTNEHNSDGA